VLEHGFVIERFVEKPDIAKAEAFLADGGYAWNGGIFTFRAGQLLDELRSQRPAMVSAVMDAVNKGTQGGQQFHPDVASFEAIEGDSIDYALMENTENAAMVPVAMGWSDIGDWSALLKALDTDQHGNHASSNAELVASRNVLAISDGPRISAIGLEDIIIVVEGGEVLVTRRDDAQKVGRLRGAQEQ